MQIRFVPLVLSALFAVGLHCPQHALASERIIIVLDASGSMWTKLNGETRIAVAKRAVEQIVRGVPDSVELGLMAYGHRQRGDCNDIEILVAPGAGKQAEVIAAANRLTPRGKTPLSEAVRRAAESMKHNESKATVILVSDGEETCDADPCEVGKELAASGVDFRAHVVGFAIEEQKADEQLKCLASATGGEYFQAKDAASLVTALVGALKKSGAQVTAPSVESTPVATPETSAAATRAGAETVRVTVHLGDDTPAIPNFAVRILKPSASEDGEEEVVDTLYSSPYRPSQPIESGEYLFEARVGQAQASMLGALPSREPIKIVLNAGRIRPKAVVTDSDDDLSGVVWTFTSASDPTAKTTEYGADKEVILPAGKWIIEARLGSATATKELDLTAGEEVTPELRLEAGVLMPRVLYAKDCEDLPESGIQIEILEAKANSMGERKSVTTEYGNTTQVKLAAGKYLIKFALGHAKGEQEVEIKSGETVKVDLVADAGVMAVSVKAPYESYEVFHARKSLDGNRRSVVRQYHAQDTETVAAGKYVVVAYGPEDQKKEVEVEVAPCSREEVEIK